MTDQTGIDVSPSTGAAARRLALTCAIATAVLFAGLLLMLWITRTYPNAYLAFLVVKVAAVVACLAPAWTLLRARRFGAGALFVLLGLCAWAIATWVSGIAAALLMGGFGAW